MDVFGANGSNITVWAPPSGVAVSMPFLGGIVGDTWLVTGLQIGAKEITDIRQCFNDVSYVYALGNDQRQCIMSVSFVVMIGKKECKDGDPLASIKDGLEAYGGTRISQMPNGGVISIGGLSRYCYLVGIDISQVDASKGICAGNAQFIMKLGDE